jgi:hypothetical protein
MECLVSMVLGLLQFSASQAMAPIVAYFLFIGQFAKAQPCGFCFAAFYLALLLGVLVEGNRGLFSGLKMSPELIELSLMQWLRYDISSGPCGVSEAGERIFMPIDSVLNYVQAFAKFLLLPASREVLRSCAD